MTICVMLNGAVINVGPWDYQAIEIHSMEELESAPPLIVDGVAIYNPLPDGAIEMILIWHGQQTDVS